MGRTSTEEKIAKIGKFILYYLFVAGALARTFVDSLYSGEFIAVHTYFLLGAFLILSLLQPFLANRFPAFTQPWLALQSMIVFTLLLIRPYHDYYAVLAIALSLVVMFELPPGRTVIWSIILLVVATAGLLVCFSGPEGLVYSPSYLAGIVFIGLYGRAYRQMQDSKLRAEKLLEELRSVNRRLRVYAGKAEEAATAHERARLARELHDAVTQTVFSMNLTLEAARRLLSEDNTRVMELFDRLQLLARDALGELRSIVSELRPRSAAEVGLGRSLEIHRASLKRREGFDVQLEINGNERGSPSQKDALFRTAQEALNNVMRHSGVRKAALKLSFLSDSIRLVLRDDGQGFDGSENCDSEGFGLTSMRERIAALRGSIDITSVPGAGTIVTVEVPLTGETSNEHEKTRYEADTDTDR